MVVSLLLCSITALGKIKTEQEATDFKNGLKDADNVYQFKVLEVSSVSGSQEIDVRWVVEIHEPTITKDVIDEEGKTTKVDVKGEELLSVGGSTTVSSGLSLNSQKKLIEDEAVLTAQNADPKVTIEYDTHDLLYSKEIK